VTSLHVTEVMRRHFQTFRRLFDGHALKLAQFSDGGSERSRSVVERRFSFAGQAQTYGPGLRLYQAASGSVFTLGSGSCSMFCCHAGAYRRAGCGYTVRPLFPSRRFLCQFHRPSQELARLCSNTFVKASLRRLSLARTV
jgi:hypothetical protein